MNQNAKGQVTMNQNAKGQVTMNQNAKGHVTVDPISKNVKIISIWDFFHCAAYMQVIDNRRLDKCFV